MPLSVGLNLNCVLSLCPPSTEHLFETLISERTAREFLLPRTDERRHMRRDELSIFSVCELHSWAAARGDEASSGRGHVESRRCCIHMCALAGARRDDVATGECPVSRSRMSKCLSVRVFVFQDSSEPRRYLDEGEYKEPHTYIVYL